MNKVKYCLTVEKSVGMVKHSLPGGNSFRQIKHNLLCAVCLTAVIFSSCGINDPSETSIDPDSKELTVISWNVQTFFDGEKEGTEYAEFLKSEDWNREKYEVRLSRLCGAISMLDADLFVLEEIENSDILYDISNQLAGDSWKKKQCWNYSCFARPSESAIGIGVLSKYPLNALCVHSMDIQIQKTAQPVSRYMLEFTVSVGGKELIVLANHWKSKSGGEKNTEIWRDWQESMLANRVYENRSLPVLCCGDFNRDAEAFVKGERKSSIVLRGISFDENIELELYSPWELVDSTAGSYFFDGEWERIDNFFCNENVRIIGFECAGGGEWIKADGTPFSYSLYNGQGYSDHLPIKARVVF